jgi:PAS domain S-box-containing protein
MTQSSDAQMPSEETDRAPHREGSTSRPTPGRSGWRLRTYFALLAACFIVAAVAAVAYVEVQTTRDTRQRALQDARATAAVSATQLSDALKVMSASIARLAANPDVAQAVSHPAGCTLTFDAGSSGSGHLDILAPTGAVACTSRPGTAGGRTASYAGASWLAAAHTRPLRVAPVTDSLTGKAAALVSTPLRGGAGIVVGFLDLRSLATELATLYGGGKPVEILVTNPTTHRVIARSVEPARWIGATLRTNEFTAPGEGLHSDLDGTRRFYATATVPGSGWRLYAGEDAHAESALGAHLQNRQLEIILAGLLSVLVAATLVYRRTARPIVRLAAAVRRTDPGTAPTAVVVDGPAEVAGLAEDVNGLISSVSSELAERQRAEEALRISEESYRLLFERHPNPMWLFDVETLGFLAVNQAAVASYGYSQDEFLSMTIDQIRPDEDRAALRQVLAAPARQHLDAGIWRHRRKDGTTIDVSISSSVVRFAGRAARIVLAHDVTTQRRIAEQLRQTQKMEAVGRLAGGVAHDFNNLLVVIRGYSAILAQSLDDPELRGHARAIDAAGERATELTRQLLALSRQQLLRPSVVDVNRVVAEAEQLLSRLIGEDIEVEIDLQAGPWAVLADAGQLGQVILNLAVNARDAMTEGGKLSIRTRNVELDSDYASNHVDVEPGQYVLLQVTDSGQGMDKETQQRVFEPFFTTKEEGTGLGLATVHGIVRQSGGHIWLYSEAGLGTTFKLYFPRTDRSIAAVEPEFDPTDLEGDETILLVEDEETVRAFIAVSLRDCGYRVLEAERADAAEEIAAQAPGIDLLITDVVMPGGNGRDLAERLRSTTPGLQVLFTSGYPSDEVFSNGDGQARIGFIEKPFGPTELARQVRAVLDSAA